MTRIEEGTKGMEGFKSPKASPRIKSGRGGVVGRVSTSASEPLPPEAGEALKEVGPRARAPASEPPPPGAEGVLRVLILGTTSGYYNFWVPGDGGAPSAPKFPSIHSIRGLLKNKVNFHFFQKIFIYSCISMSSPSK